MKRTCAVRSWIAERMQRIDVSGIRKVFDLSATMQDPINLSIGQPHFDTPQPVKDALKRAIDDGRNAYSPTQGIAPLVRKLQERVDTEFQHADRSLFVTSGTSGGLMLALSVLINPGDEVLFFDPYFVVYKHLTTLVGGKPVAVHTYPDFRVDLDKVRAALSERTKVILCNSPANPTGTVLSEADLRGLAELAAERNVALISDEIYRTFVYDGPFISPARFNERTIVIDGFSKSHSMTGLRLGYAHGPGEVIQQMIKLQQFTYVCATASPVGGAHGLRRRRLRARRRIPPQPRLYGGGALRLVRVRACWRRVLPLRQGTLGNGERIRRRGDQAQSADHPR